MWSYDKCSKIDQYKSKSLNGAIFQYSLNGNFIAEHMNSIVAAKSIGKNNPENITKCCKGIRYSAYGYQWKYYKQDMIDCVKPGRNKYKHVYQYTLDFEFIREYDSINDAALSIDGDFNKNKSKIAHCLKNEQKTALNYIWKYNLIT